MKFWKLFRFNLQYYYYIYRYSLISKPTISYEKTHSFRLWYYWHQQSRWTKSLILHYYKNSSGISCLYRILYIRTAGNVTKIRVKYFIVLLIITLLFKTTFIMKNKRIIGYKCIYVLGNIPNGSNIIPNVHR